MTNLGLQIKATSIKSVKIDFDLDFARFRFSASAKFENAREELGWCPDVTSTHGALFAFRSRVMFLNVLLPLEGTRANLKGRM